jgi:hypothetical protein
MVPPGAPSTPGDVPDGLERITGLDPWIAQLIRESGIGRVSAVAGLSAPALSAFLRERAVAALAVERIERDDWVGQARRLRGGGDDDPLVQEKGDEPEHRPPVEADRQQAGFSLFFDLARDAHGREIWHTRVYHEESGSEIILPGLEPGPWTDWILARALPAEDRPPWRATAEPSSDDSALHPLLVRVLDARIVGGRTGRVPAEALSVELRLEVAGLAELEAALGRATLSSALGRR